MGFSVSGSAAIIFAAMFIGFGMFYTATSNGFEQVSDARADQADRELTRQNTAMTIEDGTWDDANTTLVVNATNGGASALDVPEVDLLANNSYLTSYASSVEGNAATDLWAPGERLTLTVTTLETNPGRVKLVTGPGVADTATVEGA